MLSLNRLVAPWLAAGLRSLPRQSPASLCLVCVWSLGASAHAQLPMTPLGTIGRHALFFTADDRGSLLWRTDGTASGTEFVTEAPLAVDRSTQFGRALEATVVGPRVFFAGALPFTSEQVLCVSDGTHEGSRELGRFDEATRPFALGNTALFGTRTGSASELWRSDGTLAGTVRVTTLPTLPLQPRQVGGVVMMLVGSSLWQTDGTPGGTSPVPGFVQVAQIEPLADGIALLRSGMLDLYRPSSGSVSLLAPSGVTRLVGQVAGHLAYERNSSLFSVDHVRQTHPLVAAGFAGASASVGTRLLFTAGTMGGVSLWSSDGVSAIQLAAVPSLPLRSSARLQSVSNDRALFDVFPGGGGPRSWVTDGTAAGTQELPYAGNVLLLASRPGRMLGVVAQEAAPGPALLALHLAPKWDRVREFAYARSTGTELVSIATLGDRALLAGLQDVRGLQRGGTPQMVLPQFAHELLATPRAFFGASGNGLFCSDGTAAGTRWIADLTPGVAVNLRALGDSVVGVCRRPAQALWLRASSDGTTTLIPLSSATLGPVVSDPIVTPRAAYLIAFGHSSLHIEELAHGSNVSRNVANVPGSASFLGRVGHRLIVLSSSGLLAFDETDHSVTQLLPPPIAWSMFDRLELPRRLIITSESELVVTDGTPAGTVIWPIPSGSGAALGDRVCFSGYDPAHGFEPWLVDDSGAAPRLLADVLPGPGGSSPSGVLAVGDRWVFVANSEKGGREVWATDGRRVELAADLLSPGNSHPGMFAVLGNSLLCSAFDGATLRLHSIPLQHIGAALVLPLSSGCGSELRAVGPPRVGARAITLRARTQLGPAVALLGAGSGSTPIDFNGQTCDLRVTDLIAALPTRMRADVSELDLLMPGHPGAVGATLAVQFLYAKALGGAAQLVLGR